MSVSRRSIANYAVKSMLTGGKVDVLAKEIAAILAACKKQNEADAVISDIASILEKQKSQIICKVTTARQLSSTELGEIKSFVSKKTGVSKVLIEQEIDKEILGGIIIETAQRAWDLSVASQINQIRGTA